MLSDEQLAVVDELIDVMDLSAAERYSIPVSYTHLRAHETRHDLKSGPLAR